VTATPSLPLSLSFIQGRSHPLQRSVVGRASGLHFCSTYLFFWASSASTTASPVPRMHCVLHVPLVHVFTASPSRVRLSSLCTAGFSQALLPRRSELPDSSPASAPPSTLYFSCLLFPSAFLFTESSSRCTPPNRPTHPPLDPPPSFSPLRPCFFTQFLPRLFERAILSVPRLHFFPLSLLREVLTPLFPWALPPPRLAHFCLSGQPGRCLLPCRAPRLSHRVSFDSFSRGRHVRVVLEASPGEFLPALAYVPIAPSFCSCTLFPPSTLITPAFMR